MSDSTDGAGYLLKDRISDVPEFVAAIRRVAAGGFAIDPSIIATLLDKRRTDDPLASLTPRERQVLELMAEGRSNQGIADKLVITLRAAERHVSNVFEGRRSTVRCQRFTTCPCRTAVPALLNRWSECRV